MIFNQIYQIRLTVSGGISYQARLNPWLAGLPQPVVVFFTFNKNSPAYSGFYQRSRVATFRRILAKKGLFVLQRDAEETTPKMAQNS